MRKVLMGVAVGFQLLVLGFMAGEREWVVLKGRTVYLRTQPVDPRDPFRGDYVRLDYEVNHVATNAVAADLLARGDRWNRGRKVYAVLSCDEDGFGSVSHLTGKKPDEGLFLRGRSSFFYSGNPVMAVNYGIEAYFVEQGAGRKIEEGRVRGDVRVPLDMEIAVGHGGIAVLKAHHWCPLGIGLKLENNTNRQVRAAVVTLVNVSSNDLAVLDPVSSGRLRLEPDSIRNWGGSTWEWVGKDQAMLPPEEGAVIVLKPGQGTSVQVDLSRPEWFVRKRDAVPQSITGLRDFAGFRFVYQAPEKAACAGLRNAGLVWHGLLRSQVFTGGGRLD
jgi:uncharacterized membrane-anchored protein